MAYVYRHIRLDINAPFYVGIGNSSKYARAYSKFARNKIWYGITAKTEYTVEIRYDNLSWEDACKKEIELINLYGQIIHNTGSLCNLTGGGEGCLNLKPSLETIKKRSAKLKGRKFSTEHRKKLSLAAQKRTVSEQTKSKMSKSRLGLKLGPAKFETKLKISLAHLGKKRPGKTVIDTVTGDKYSSARLVSELFNVNYNTLNTQLTVGARRKSNKYRFVYEDPKDSK